MRDVFEKSNFEGPIFGQQVQKDDVCEFFVGCSQMWAYCPIHVSVYAREFDFNL